MSIQSTVRISSKSQNLLKEFANQDNKTMHEVIDDLIEQEKRKRFFDDFDKAYAKLRGNSKAWDEELEERQEWDCTLMDGIDRGEKFNEVGDLLPNDESK